jgi:hypothetical protein
VKGHVPAAGLEAIVYEAGDVHRLAGVNRFAVDGETIGEAAQAIGVGWAVVTSIRAPPSSSRQTSTRFLDRSNPAYNMAGGFSWRSIADTWSRRWP